MIVIDSSIVAKLVLDEEGSDKVKSLFQGREQLVVPDILFVEIANTLATKAEATIGMVEEGIELVYGLEAAVEKVDKKLLVEAAKLAKEKGTAVYDMVYAVLARKLGAELVTADRKFVKKVGWKFVKVLNG